MSQRGDVCCKYRPFPVLSFSTEASGNSIPPVRDHANLQVWHDHEGSGGLFCQTLGEQHWIWWPDLAAYSFDRVRDQVDIHSEPLANRSIIIDSYWRYVLPIVEHLRGKECLHASAIRGPNGLVLFCGESGSGKSTLAYGLKERGYTFWADDAVVFEMHDGVARAHAIPFKIHLRSQSLAHFRLATDAPELRLRDGAESTSTQEKVSSIVVLERADSESEGPCSIFELPAPRAFTNLLTHARCFSLKDERRRRDMLQTYLHLVNAVPVRRLRLASGLERLPAILDKIEHEFTG